MKVRFRFVLTVIVFLVTVFCLFKFRTVPVSKIWNNYSVLYAEKSVPEETVSAYLKDAGCKDVIALKEQRVPFVSRYLPVAPSQSSYMSDREMYFTDEECRYNLFYVPEKYHDNAKEALGGLEKKFRAVAGMDGSIQFPWMVPVVCTLVYLIFLAFAKFKSVYFVAGFFPLLLPFSMPFYSVTAGICLLEFSLFLMNVLWGRRKQLRAAVSNFYIVVLLVSAEAIFFVSSRLCGFLSLLVMTCSFISILFVKSTEEKKDSKSAFSYKYIFSAKQLAVMTKRNSVLLLVVSFSIATVFGCFVYSYKRNAKVDFAGVSLPSPVNPNSVSYGKRLPNLNDYFRWAWNTKVFPYKSLHNFRSVENVADGDRITVIEYEETAEGIKSREKVLFEYDSKFKDSCEKDIEKFDYPAIEKLMLEQGRDVQVSYSSGSDSGTYGSENFFMSFILILAAFGESVLLFFIYRATVKA